MFPENEHSELLRQTAQQPDDWNEINNEPIVWILSGVIAALGLVMIFF